MLRVEYGGGGSQGAASPSLPTSPIGWRRWVQTRALLVLLGLLLGLGTSPKSAAAQDGKAIFARQCSSCHNVTGPAPATFEGVLNRKAPDLFYAGSKFNRPWLVEWLQGPTPIRPAGVMFLNHLVTEDGVDSIAQNTVKPCPADLSPALAVKMADYLMTLKDATMRAGLIDPAKKFAKAKAQRLFRKQLPCIGCHIIRRGRKTMGGVSGPNLTEAGRRLNPDWVYAKIENPQHWDPKIWMPRLKMSHGDRELLTLFIGSMKQRWESEIAQSDAAASTPPTMAQTGGAGQIYRNYCAQCHGTQGTGRGINETSGSLAASPRFHTSSEEMAKLSDEDIRRVITDGGGAIQLSELMPSWGGTLTAGEIDALVVYLRKLCQCQGRK